MIDEILCTLILQTYGIQHSRRSFRHTGIQIPFAWLDRCSFHKNTTQAGDIHKVRILNAISESTRRRHDRVLQLQITDVYV